MFRAGISEETLLSISCIKGLSPEILLFKRKGTVSRDFSLRDGILPTKLLRNIANIQPTFLKMGQSLLANLGQIYYKLSEDIGNPLKYCSMVTESIGNYCKFEVFLRRSSVPSDQVQKIMNTLWISYQKVLDKLQRHFQDR